MELIQRVYSALIVSVAPSFNDAVPTLFPKPQFDDVRLTSNLDAAKRALVEKEFDFVVVNTPLPDGVGMRFAIDVCTTTNSVALLLTRADEYMDVYERVSLYGAFVLSKPSSLSSFREALRWMRSARERLRRLQTKTITIEEKMKEIRLVNRAKWILIETFRMDEASAHRFIEKTAMDRCVSKGTVAREIIDKNS